MPNRHTILLGKTVKYIARLRGGGSALPGLFVEKIDPDFISHTLSQLPMGTIIISGTNGKTTTTKMVVELLEGQGVTVFTNRTGSNFTRGVAAALLGEVDMNGQLSADIAVLELDEAHAVHFVQAVQPRHCLLLNVMRDQLDRFGEIDTTARMLQTIAEATTENIVLNREDPRVRAIASSVPAARVSYYGLSDMTRELFPDDDSIRSGSNTPSDLPPANVVLTSLHENEAVFEIDNQHLPATLKLKGVYNVFNAAAALALVKACLGEKLDYTKLLESLANVTPAFGRGETILVNGRPVELVLVKNPSGFQLSLASFDARNYATMIAINDNYADGRDMSWLWDVDFDSLSEEGVAVVSGIRAYDMALRLQYNDVEMTHVEPGLPAALKYLVDQYGDRPKRIYCTYTAMLAIRRELAKLTTVQKAIN